MTILRIIFSFIALILKLPLIAYGIYWLGLIAISIVIIIQKGLEPTSFMLYIGAFHTIYGFLFVLPNRAILNGKWRPHVYWVLMAIPAIALPLYADQLPYEYVEGLTEQIQMFAVIGMGVPFAVGIVSLIFAAISMKVRARIVGLDENSSRSNTLNSHQERKEPTFQEK